MRCNLSWELPDWLWGRGAPSDSRSTHSTEKDKGEDCRAPVSPGREATVLFSRNPAFWGFRYIYCCSTWWLSPSPCCPGSLEESNVVIRLFPGLEKYQGDHFGKGLKGTEVPSHQHPPKRVHPSLLQNDTRNYLSCLIKISPLQPRQHKQFIYSPPPPQFPS